MAVNQPKTIDFIGVERASGSVVLTIADHLEWTDSRAHQVILQEKINSYLAFIESGEIAESYPDARGRRAIINVLGKYSPDAEGYRFLEEAKATIESAGIGFRFEVFSGSSD